MAITEVGTYQDFAAGSQHTFTAPADGLYKLEVWGSQGGISELGSVEGAPGGYAVGYKLFGKGQVIYIVCGNRDGYNGGGYGYVSGISNKRAYGGGATHMAFASGLLQNLSGNRNSILLVAGGGGGGAKPFWNGTGSGGGGSGGGTTGYSASIPSAWNNVVNSWPGNMERVASQTQPGRNYQDYTIGGFGYGGHAWLLNADDGSYVYAGGGGGGYFGGSGGCIGNGYGTFGGGGGAGFIGGVPTITHQGVTYASAMSNGARSGHGLARITLIKKSVPTIYLGTRQVGGLMLGAKEASGLALGSKVL